MTARMLALSGHRDCTAAHGSSPRLHKVRRSRISFANLRSLVALLVTVPVPAMASPESVEIPPLLASAQTHARGAGEELWRGYGSASFGVLLVGSEEERLFCQPAPPGFAVLPGDPVTGCAVSSRVRGRLPGNLLAAMPIFGIPSTIVVGTPDATGRQPAAWVRTLLHEHFHQWQNALPDYYRRVDALDLKKGDETGMWMLNFPVPYDDAAVGAAHAEASRRLLTAIEARGERDFRRALRRYLSARSDFARTLGADNWRYVEFQLWQEGVARWTEIELGRSHPYPAVRASAEALAREVSSDLRSPRLASQQRTFVYSHGAAEAMLLERCNPGWKTPYVRTLQLGSLLGGCLTPLTRG